MTKKYEMPKRLPEDGMVAVYRVGDTHIRLSAEGDGSMVISEFNAWRIFGLLSLILDLPISDEAGEAINFGTEAKMVFDRGDRSKWTMGQRVAANIADRMLAEGLERKAMEMARKVDEG